jgi:hypothetical protein
MRPWHEVMNECESINSGWQIIIVTWSPEMREIIGVHVRKIAFRR